MPIVQGKCLAETQLGECSSKSSNGSGVHISKPFWHTAPAAELLTAKLNNALLHTFKIVKECVANTLPSFPQIFHLWPILDKITQ